MDEDGCSVVGKGSFNVSIGGFSYLTGSVLGDFSWLSCLVLPHS